MSQTTAIPGPAAAPLQAVRTRLAVVLCSHTMVDIFAAFVPPLLGVLEVRCRLTATQTAWLLGIGSLTSGVSQPISALLSDRIDSRLFAPVGLAVAAVCLSNLGSADSYAGLLVLYCLGMIGVGVYHPIGAASIGHIADRLPGARRHLGISIFFVAGMAGGMTGSLLSPWLARQPGGFELMRYVMIPGLVVAAVLQLAIGRVPHRDAGHGGAARGGREAWQSWKMIGLLYVSNAMRFTVNMALLYLFVRWAEAPLIRSHPEWSREEVASAASRVTGSVNALLVLGMALGGMVAGALVRRGAERRPLVLTPMVAAPAIALFGLAPTWAGYVLAVLCGAGFAAMVPVSLSLAQRLLPHRTSLASGLMLGGAWTLGMLGPAAAAHCLYALNLSLATTFVLTAGLLFCSGVACLGIQGRERLSD